MYAIHIIILSITFDAYYNPSIIGRYTYLLRAYYTVRPTSAFSFHDNPPWRFQRSKSQRYSPTRDRGTHVCREPATEDGFSSRPVLLYNRITYVFIASLSPVCGIKIAAPPLLCSYIVRLRGPIVMPTNNNIVRNDVGILYTSVWNRGRGKRVTVT